MNCPADTNGAIDARRFPRYEIDTEVDVATLGARDQRVMRGRSLTSVRPEFLGSSLLIDRKG